MNLAAFPEGIGLYFKAKRAESAERQREARSNNEGALASAPCSSRIISFHHSQGRSRSWADLVATAPAIYRGRIVAMAPGFEAARPVTLLVVETAKPLRRTIGYPESGRIHVLYEGADFRIDTERFCSASPNEGVMPEVGDEILLMAYQPAPDEAGTFLRPAPEHIFVSRGGRLLLPSVLAGDASLPTPLTIDALSIAVMKPGTSKRNSR
jgi:hypothetical protein